MPKIILTIVGIYLFYKYVLPIILFPLKVIIKGIITAIIVLAVIASIAYLALY